MKPTISTETQQDALAVAKSIQKPGQTKEQTKLIAQGIEKGIAEYKKQQKVKARERDKVRKQQLKSKAQASSALLEDDQSDEHDNAPSQLTAATWVCLALLLLSWLGFGLYLLR